MAVGIYRGPSKGQSGKISDTKSESTYVKETPEQKEQVEKDIRSDCALKATIEQKENENGIDPKTKEKIVVLTLEPGSVKSRLERTGVPPATMREVYKILGIEWNEKDE